MALVMKYQMVLKKQELNLLSRFMISFMNGFLNSSTPLS